MTDHTTIQITKAQADELQARRTHDDESYKSVIARLLEGDSSAINSDELVADIAAEVDTAAFNGGMSGEKADRILGRLDDLETEFQTLRDGLRG